MVLPMSSKPSFPARLVVTQKSAGPKPGKAMAVVAAPRSLQQLPAGAKMNLAEQGGEWAVAHRRALVDKLSQRESFDPRVLAAIGQIPRHQFVDSALAPQAYEDTSLPIGLGQTISKPSVVARMLTLLLQEARQPLGKVLEIGTGCGYQAAVLSHLAKEVHSVERLRQLHERAKRNVGPLFIGNLHLMFGDGMLGYAKGMPYDAIISAAGGDAIAQTWVEQLAVGGCIVAPTAAHGGESSGGGQCLVVVKKSATGITSHTFEAVQFVPLKSGLG
jgi:protein-L-isoaspartate(D-aspartate) O-methyltransferase